MVVLASSGAGYVYLVVSISHLARLCTIVSALLSVFGVNLLLLAVLSCGMTCNWRRLSRTFDPLSQAEMSTSLIPKHNAKRARALRCLQITGFVIAFLLVAAMWVVLGFYVWIADATLPRWNGNVTIPGLDQPVFVHTTKDGMVTVNASTISDLVYAQGYIHARHRLWQLEFQRRLGQGTLSEIVGSAALDQDKQMRTLGIYAAAERAVHVLDNSTRQILDRYVAGINEYILKTDHLPLEFHILNFKPKAWTVQDSMVWPKLMALDLSGNLNDELERWRLLTKQNLSPSRINQLKPPYDVRRFPTVLSAQSIQGGGVLEQNDRPEWYGHETDLPESVERLLARLQQQQQPPDAPEEPSTNESGEWSISDTLWSMCPLCTSASGSSAESPPPFGFARNLKNRKQMAWHMGASNNWVVGGNFTKSRLPLLANDPHLMLTAPSVWILMALNTDNHVIGDGKKFNVVGSSFVGVPAIVLGHNGYISWAVTNTGADVQDLYIMNETNRTHYWHNNSHVAYKVRNELIHVKSGDPVQLVIRESVYGPVVTDTIYSKDSDLPLSLQWTAIMPSVPDTTLAASWLVNHARNWTEFRNALALYVVPSQNFIYADVAGHIGYQMPGKIPIRAGDHTGAWPEVGNGEKDWQGFIAYDDLPRSLDPIEGFIVSANNKVTPPNYKYVITADWDSGSEGYRALRITDMILDQMEHTVETMQDMQGDTVSYLAWDLSTLVLQLPWSGFQTLAGKRAWLWIYANFEFAEFSTDMAIGNQLATLIQRWFIELSRIGSPETGVDFWNDPVFIVNALNGTGAQPDPACAADSPTCTLTALRAFERAANALMGPDMSWIVPRWGIDVHRATIVHPILGHSALACLANRHVAHGGDMSTINVGHYDMATYAMTSGPTYRHIVDLSNVLGASVFMNALGNDGHILAAPYDAWLTDWAFMRYIPMRSSTPHDTDINTQCLH
eukprot:c3238_g1_i1.p1 GENE.c3238_g1_i1~~c3238_g1_i1.p1  ORF type:complete len:983 (-),score=215.43 c3238_g1_i1:156-3029(-)